MPKLKLRILIAPLLIAILSSISIAADSNGVAGCVGELVSKLDANVLPVESLDQKFGIGYKRFVTGHYPADPEVRSKYIERAEAKGFIEWYIGVAVAPDLRSARDLALQYAEGYKLEKGQKDTVSSKSAYNPLPSDVLILIANPDELLIPNSLYNQNDPKSMPLKINEAAYEKALMQARMVRFPFNKDFTELSDKPIDISLSDRTRFNLNEKNLVIDTKAGGIPTVRMGGLAHPDPRGALNVESFLSSKTGKALISKLRTYAGENGTHEVRISSNIEAVLNQLIVQVRRHQAASMNRYANVSLQNTIRSGFEDGIVFTVEIWTKSDSPTLVGGVLGKITSGRALMIETMYQENRTQVIGFKTDTEMKSFVQLAAVNGTDPGHFYFDELNSIWMSDRPYVQKDFGYLQQEPPTYYKQGAFGLIHSWEDSVIFPKMAVAVVVDIAKKLGVKDIDMGMVSNWTWALGAEYHQGDFVVEQMFGLPFTIQMPAKDSLWIPPAPGASHKVEKVRRGPSVRAQKDQAFEEARDPLHIAMKKAERAAKKAAAATSKSDADLAVQAAEEQAALATKLASEAAPEKRAAAEENAEKAREFATQARAAAASK